MEQCSYLEEMDAKRVKIPTTWFLFEAYSRGHFGSI
jgi:hypothetical protein